MVKLYYGDEPYYLQSEREKVLKEEDMNAGRYASWEEAKEMVSILPVFAERRIVVLEIDKLSADDSLLSYLKEPVESTDLYIFCKQVDKNTKVFKLLKKEYSVQECNKLSESMLCKWVYKKLEEYGAVMEEAAYELFVRRSCYWDNPDCSLFTVRTWLYQMSTVSTHISCEIVEQVVPETLNEKMFALSKYLLQGDYPAVFKLANMLLQEKEQPIAMLSAVLRTFRLAYKAALYSDIEGRELGRMLGAPYYQYADAMKYVPDILCSCMQDLQNAVNLIKSGSMEQVTFISALGEICERLKKEEVCA